MKKLIIELDTSKILISKDDFQKMFEKTYKQELKKEIQRLVKADAVKRANIIYKNFGGNDVRW